MRDRRRAGLTVPNGRPPADRALLQAPIERAPDHQHDSWRVLRFVSEFVEGFDALADIGPAVPCFGSARTPPDDVLVRRGTGLGSALARRRGSVVTRGRPGMVAAGHPGRPRSAAPS